MASPSTRVTATLANASERRSIFGQYAQTPIYHKPVTVEAPSRRKGLPRSGTTVYRSKSALSRPPARGQALLGTG